MKSRSLPITTPTKIHTFSLAAVPPLPYPIIKPSSPFQLPPHSHTPHSKQTETSTPYKNDERLEHVEQVAPSTRENTPQNPQKQPAQPAHGRGVQVCLAC
jgi:hypothetical protein